MIITVDLAPEVESKIKLQAAGNGVPMDAYVKTLIEEAAARHERIAALAVKPFDEILAPVREGFAASGLSEDEIMAMFAEARDEIQQEKQNAR